jgi:hypothetical protein
MSGIELLASLKEYTVKVPRKKKINVRRYFELPGDLRTPLTPSLKWRVRG